MIATTARLFIGASNSDFGWSCLRHDFISSHGDESFAALRLEFGLHQDAEDAQEISDAITAVMQKIFVAWKGKTYVVVCECVPSRDKVRLYKGLFYKDRCVGSVVYQGQRDAGNGVTILVGVVDVTKENATNAISRLNSFRSYACLVHEPQAVQLVADKTLDAMVVGDPAFCSLDFPEIVSHVCMSGGVVIRPLWGTMSALILYAAAEEQLAALRF